ncbi:MAG: putative toxin-antitoxin system toxin component, PIN family [Pirellulales bacterium]
MNVVLDTNVIIAAFASRGLCEAVMTVCLDRGRLVTSEFILDEVAEKLASKLKMPPTRVREIVKFLRDNARVVTPADVPANACPDADDLPILGTMIAAGADCLVTGDAALLAIGQHAGIAIHSPRQFYEQLK